MTQPRQQAAVSLPQLFAFPFRIFFLSAALAGGLLVPVWLAWLQGGAGSQLAAMPTLFWHQHEMAVGFLDAAIAGFLLTAVCNWTGTAPVAGKRLLLMWLVWLAGRLAMLLGGSWGIWASVVDLAFMPLVMVAAGWRVWSARQRRQLLLMVVLAALWLMDLAFHVSGSPHFIQSRLVLAGMLILIIGGRITPAFTANWLRANGGDPAALRQSATLDQVGMALMALVLLMVASGVSGALLAMAALLAALVLLARLSGWGLWQVRREPLLWILHAGQGWIAVALVLLALAQWHWVAPTAWLHALGAGAIGTMIIGVMTRVAMGHTGRPLMLLPGALWCYWLMLLAGLVRVFTALGVVPWQAGIWISGLAWTLSLLWFAVRYFPVLASRRADGKPG